MGKVYFFKSRVATETVLAEGVKAVTIKFFYWRCRKTAVAKFNGFDFCCSDVNGSEVENPVERCGRFVFGGWSPQVSASNLTKLHLQCSTFRR